MEVEIMRTRKRCSLFLAAAASVALALSGCSSGGASTRPDDGPTGSAGAVVDAAEKNQVVAMGARRVILGAANAMPGSGSVTQSSNVDANTDVTIDRVEVTAKYGPSGPSFTVANGMDWQIDASDGDPVPISDASSPWQGVGLSKKLADATLYVDVYTDIDAPTEGFDCGVGASLTTGDFCVYEHSSNAHTSVEFEFEVNADGSACVSVHCHGSTLTFGDFQAMKVGTDWEIERLPAGATPIDGSRSLSTPDADYLAGGVWLVVPDDATEVHAYVFGAFADGRDPFDQTNLQALTGTAIYEGDATGVYSEVAADSTNIGYFDGDVMLTADFGDGSANGTISGMISDFEIDGVAAEDGMLNLGQADIGSQDSGFFQGLVTGSDTERTYEGQWGGQFFGNGETDGKPGSVAGTFGGHSTDDAVSFVGVFGAHRQQ